MANYDPIFQAISQNLGIPKASLQKAMSSGDPNALLSLLDQDKAAALQTILSDPKSLKQTLNSKQARALQNEFKP